MGRWADGQTGREKADRQAGKAGWQAGRHSMELENVNYCRIAVRDWK
jgi:hypothetical protein